MTTPEAKLFPGVLHMTQRVSLRLPRLMDGGEATWYEIGSAFLDLDTGRLWAVEIDRAFRGMGYGHQLVRQVVAEARRAGLHRVELWVRRDNLTAINLYSDFGFQVVDDPEFPPYFNCLRMALNLFAGPRVDKNGDLTCAE